MARKKRVKEKSTGAPPWMVSLSDMNTLLMCFFILLMGEDIPITQGELQLTLSSVQASLGVMPGGNTVSPGQLMEMGHNVMALIATTPERELGKVKRQANEIFRVETRARHVVIREDERGLVITLMGDIFFESGSARLLPPIRNVLHKVAGLIKEVPNYVRIEGHTDNLAPSASRDRGGFETNWELSAARSLNVTRYLVEEESVNSKQVASVAFAENRPIDTNATPEGRAANRRVDIVILKDRMLPEDRHPEISRPLPNEEWQ
jgi:chemotaxis protein MotB